MDRESYERTHKRIIELNGFDGEGDPIVELLNNAGAADWHVTLDSSTASENDTRRMPCDTLLLLGPDGKVPARNLPSSISTVTGACVEVTFDPLDRSSQGWTGGTVDKVYFRTSGDITTFYRWYADGDLSRYVVIANNLRYIDGVATEVVDDPSSGVYTRKLDLVLGNPSVTDASQPLRLSSGQELTHSLSGVAAGTYPASQQGTPGFGGDFAVPGYTVNSSGHVTSADGAASVTVPDTAASGSSVPGLVRVGTSTPLPIQSDSSPGHYAPSADGYVEVSAADHTHAASTLRVANFPHMVTRQVAYGGIVSYRDELTYDDITYNMAAAVTVDMGKALAAPAVSAYPASAGTVLGATAGPATSWRTVADCWGDDLATATGQPVHVGTQGTEVARVSGLVPAKPALVTVNARVRVDSAPVGNTVSNLPSIYELTFSMLGVKRTVSVPAQYAYTMAYPVSFSMAVIPLAAASVPLVVTADPVFSVEVVSLAAKQLR